MSEPASECGDCVTPTAAEVHHLPLRRQGQGGGKILVSLGAEHRVDTLSAGGPAPVTAELKVRRAKPGDAGEIASVQVRARRVAYRGLVSAEVLEALSVKEREKRWREILAAAGASSSTLVAIAEGRVDGFCTLAMPSRDEDADGRTAEIAAIYVDPQLWRTGVGSALLGAGLDELRQGGWRHVTLWVFAQNASARAFYSRFGFEADGTEKTRRLGWEAEVRLRVSLTA